MAFCKISASNKHEGYTILDNAFFTDYLLYAPADCVKVYMWGLFVANNSENDNTIEKMSQALNISTEDIINVFLYWQERGLVQLVQLQQAQVIYLPVKTAIGNLKKFKIGKYNDFNILIQELFKNRTITSNEFTEYYTVLESFKMQPEALLEIAKYAISIKGDSVGHRYITTIAKQWAYENILSVENVKEKIQDLSLHNDKLMIVLNALKSKASPQIEDKEMLEKWLNNMGFDLDVIVFVAKELKSNGRRADMTNLDRMLCKYFELKLQSTQEIEEYEKNKQELNALARNITRSLGLYYEDVTNIVETYILPFEQIGISHELMLSVAEYCFKQSIRTLEGFADILKKLYKLGIVDLNAFQQYIGDLVANDNQIKHILSTLGMTRRVNDVDRNFYKTWTSVWNFNNDIIDFACELSVGKPSAITYMNRILSNWHTANINTLEKAKSFAPKYSISKKSGDANNFTTKEYTDEQLNSLFSNLDEVEI